MDPTSIQTYSRDQLLMLAKVAHQTDQYKDMVVLTRRLLVLSALDTSSFLTTVERDLLAHAYKQVAGPLRAGIRVVDRYGLVIVCVDVF